MDGRGMYTHSTVQDYPSISQINLKVKQNAINVIFAVTAEQIAVYERLREHVEGASAGTLSNDSANVVELVRDQYDVSTTRILCRWSSVFLCHSRLKFFSSFSENFFFC